MERDRDKARIRERWTQRQRETEAERQRGDGGCLQGGAPRRGECRRGWFRGGSGGVDLRAARAQGRRQCASLCPGELPPATPLPPQF